MKSCYMVDFGNAVVIQTKEGVELAYMKESVGFWVDARTRLPLEQREIEDLYSKIDWDLT